MALLLACQCLDDAFWAGIDGVLTALDSLEARLFVDRKCVRHRKPLVDAGTLGAKGSVQVRYEAARAWATWNQCCRLASL